MMKEKGLLVIQGGEEEDKMQIIDLLSPTT
jgi:hypothetical protein